VTFGQQRVERSDLIRHRQPRNELTARTHPKAMHYKGIESGSLFNTGQAARYFLDQRDALQKIVVGIFAYRPLDCNCKACDNATLVGG